MNKWKWFFACALALSLAACGKTNDEKAQDEANGAIAEHNALASELNMQSDPSSSWSEAQLNAYEAKLNRLEALEQKLSAMNGSHGISIYGGYNAFGIQARRVALVEARSAKAVALGKIAAAWAPPPAEIAWSRLNELSAESDATYEAFRKLPFMDRAQMPAEEMERRRAMAQKGIDSENEILRLLNDGSFSGLASDSKSAQTLKDMKASCQSRIAYFETNLAVLNGTSAEPNKAK